MAKVLFFGITGDIAGTKEKSYSAQSLAGLQEMLFNDFPALKNCIFRIAVNGVVVSGDKEIENEETVALLPPFGGG